MTILTLSPSVLPLSTCVFATSGLKYDNLVILGGGEGVEGLEEAVDVLFGGVDGERDAEGVEVVGGHGAEVDGVVGHEAVGGLDGGVVDEFDRLDAG